MFLQTAPNRLLLSARAAVQELQCQKKIQTPMFDMRTFSNSTSQFLRVKKVLFAL